MPAQWSIEDVKDFEKTCYRVETAADFLKRHTYVRDIEAIRDPNGPSNIWAADGTEREDITEDTLIKTMDPICNWLVFGGLPMTGHARLTFKNIEDVYKRLRLIGDRFAGERPQDWKDKKHFFFDITMDDLIKFVGIYNTGTSSQLKKVTVFCEEFKISSKEWRSWAA